ncbi:aminotransferase class I/II-fold pyridoxal phosphate-dependent enzyme [Maribacter chungangensis]|uniref:Aminotransferase class I/II-fold pyridoxal phosphate-dependent enzyme n=1 Tax=Maribacter chungangensis TaxID=1069117 RepID=A0ABW3B7F8_9FLAO
MAGRRKDKTLRTLYAHQGNIDFLSNDYLGFAKNETLFSKTFQLLLNEGVASNGSGGSRLLSGNHKLYGILEPQLAMFYSADAALVFNSGYDANMGLFSAVPQRGDLILYDEFIHASIREGIRMSHAKSYHFSHNDMDSLKEKIAFNTTQLAKDATIYIVTESVFSMDGDTPNLKALVAYAGKNGYRLIVDEAHAVGVHGSHGGGIIPQLKLEKKVFARTVTFGKAFGCHGAAVLGSKELRDYLVNFAKSFIYTTALPPHTLATIISAHDFFSTSAKEEVQKLTGNINYFKEEVKKQGLEKHFIASESPIQSCIITGVGKAKSVATKLMEKGFGVKAILSPTVPEGKERLRFCIHSYNSKEELGLVLKLLSTYL